MATPLTNDQLERLLRFVGYGRLAAPVWFMGIEEQGGDEYSLHQRSRFGVIEDCKCAHAKIGQRSHHLGKCAWQPTWWRMCAIMLELEGQPNDREARRSYQVNELGSKSGDTLLLDLLPIPNRNTGTWDYQDLLPQYSASRSQYEQTVLPDRIAYIRDLVREHDPKVVVCHGKSRLQDFQAIFNDMTFHDFHHMPAFSIITLGKHWRIAINEERVVLVTQNLSRINGIGQTASAVASIVRSTGHDRWLCLGHGRVEVASDCEPL